MITQLTSLRGRRGQKVGRAWNHLENHVLSLHRHALADIRAAVTHKLGKDDHATHQPSETPWAKSWSRLEPPRKPCSQPPPPRTCRHTCRRNAQAWKR